MDRKNNLVYLVLNVGVSVPQSFKVIKSSPFILKRHLSLSIYPEFFSLICL